MTAREEASSSSCWRRRRTSKIHLAKPAMRLKVADTVAALRKQETHLLDQIALMVGDVAVKFLARPDHNFGGSGRSGRAQVGHKIGDGEIGFVSHAQRSPAQRKPQSRGQLFPR